MGVDLLILTGGFATMPKKDPLAAALEAAITKVRLPVAPPAPPRIEAIAKYTQIAGHFSDASKNTMFSKKERAVFANAALTYFTFALNSTQG
jgi:hypothetical protein